MVALNPLPPSGLARRLVSSVLFVLCLATIGANAQRRNETITQDNTSIVWRGEWRNVNDSRSVGGVYRMARSAGATAEFSFIGVAVYFEAPLWPFPIASNVSVDGRRGTVLNLQDMASSEAPRTSPATVGAAVISRGVWTNLENRVHTVRVSVPIGDQAAVFDNFIITRCTGACAPTATETETDTETETETATSLLPTETPDDDDLDDGLDDDLPVVTNTVVTVEVLPPVTQTIIEVSETGPGSSGSRDDGGSSSSSSSPSRNGLAIGFGVAFGVIVLILILGIGWWLIRRKRLLSEAEAGAPYTHGGGSAGAVAASGGAAGGAAAAAAGSIAGSGDGPEVPTRERQRDGEGASVLGRPGFAGGSGTATPMSAGLAGIGAREVTRRHSYDGPKRLSGMMMPHSQPEPWDDYQSRGANPERGRAF